MTTHATEEFLTDEEKRLKIALACPLVEISRDEFKTARYWDHNGNFVEFDPLNDLNAMNYAEKHAIAEDKSRPPRFGRVYEHELEKLTGWNNQWHATAKQRASAFLATIV